MNKFLGDGLVSEVRVGVAQVRQHAGESFSVRESLFEEAGEAESVAQHSEVLETESEQDFFGWLPERVFTHAVVVLREFHEILGGDAHRSCF